MSTTLGYGTVTQLLIIISYYQVNVSIFIDLMFSFHELPLRVCGFYSITSFVLNIEIGCVEYLDISISLSIYP